MQSSVRGIMNVPRIFIFSLGQFSSVLQYDDDPMIIEQFRTLKAKCRTDWTDGPYCYGTKSIGPERC